MGGAQELRTCGNGLAFIDTDESYKLEQCNEYFLVDCGARTELEPPISTTNCPRLFGTFADPEDCSVFWNCQDGVANRYECPPGLAWDEITHACRWANEVPECSAQVIATDDEGGEFQCPPPTEGVFTKHPHPGDCRIFFLCINGVQGSHNVHWARCLTPGLETVLTGSVLTLKQSLNVPLIMLQLMVCDPSNKH